jgi:hypothetical protein
MKTKHMIGMSLFAIASAMLSGCATSPVGECATDCAEPVGECLEPVSACPTTTRIREIPAIRERVQYQTVAPSCY